MSIPAKSCSIKDCDSLGYKSKYGTYSFAKGLCIKHYKRLRAYGDPRLTKADIVPPRITIENRAYYSMLRRCKDKNHKQYKDYGGRGIKVCERWQAPDGKGYNNFLEDMGKRPSAGHSLDRIDNDGDYSPSNCRWATIQEQSHNRRSNVRITFSGKTQTLTQWSRETGIKVSTIRRRRSSGWPIEKLFIPPKSAR